MCLCFIASPEVIKPQMNVNFKLLLSIFIAIARNKRIFTLEMQKHDGMLTGLISCLVELSIIKKAESGITVDV